MLDEAFICEKCGKKVEKLNYSARDHCPYCLYSKHVDINPGDRQNNCRGLLKPIDIEKFKNTYKIIYKCEKCGEIHKNIIAKDDDMDKIIEISKKA
ncbi:MAG TPA: RNHCP domain-containing protein [Candidatus Aphodocola excrementigallinarum]|uniref:RNHCP domain-containing protein n=1 Tax=Candidatus Aphodocola excrementigallinarum TaxID=2840670 RepID=A0A9D1IPF3_9FIRM|nr:RNHCP domain-containing protein [Candidatus Aphodocola excrementigallinarum]